MILTDMIAPPVTIAKDTSKWWWNMFFRMRVRSQHNSIKQYDGFVFLTKYMNNKYNPLQKPYIVMEGSVDYKFKSQPILPTHASRVVMYAGAVEAEYGFDTLLKAFMELPIKDVKLHIYGDGKFIKQLLAYQEQDARIKYMGVVSNEEIIQAEQQATILVNPRLSNQELVKYSFPSKTTEYMLSGTPVLTTKLCGIPEEYYPHLYTFDEESVEGFKNKLLETLSLTNDELRQKGLDAQRFVLENKNNIKQAQRVEQFFEEIIANNRK
jgi:glycosyltransferase involved in cell wall biosynthesis